MAGLGAYGLRISGAPGADQLLGEVAADAPELTIERCIGEPRIVGTGVGVERAQFELEDDGLLALEVWRRPLRARFTGRRPPNDQALVHPFLVLAAATAAHWRGWDSLHAGAFRLGDGAWGILGDRNAGKSSLLCGLAVRGVDVMTDDLLVLAADDVLAGPNSVDLRGEAAQRLGVGEPLGVVGARERWRYRTPPSAPSARLAGFLSLSWGERLEMVPVPATLRVPALLAGSTLGLPPMQPQRLIELAALPAWELRRPREWSVLGETCDLLVERLG